MFMTLYAVGSLPGPHVFGGYNGETGEGAVGLLKGTLDQSGGSY